MAFDVSTFDQLQQLRAHHQEQLRRIDDALDLLKGVGKLASKASRLTGKLQRPSAAAERRPNQPTAIDYVRKHGDLRATSPKLEIQRLQKIARDHGFIIGLPGLQAAFYMVRRESKKPRGKQPPTAQQALPLAGRGTQPPVKAKLAKKGKSKWQIKRERARSGDTTTTRIRQFMIANGSGPHTREAIEAGARLGDIIRHGYVAQATARVLSKMADDKEVKRTKDGWVPLRLQELTKADDNGAAAQ